MAEQVIQATSTVPALRIDQEGSGPALRVGTSDLVGLFEVLRDGTPNFTGTSATATAGTVQAVPATVRGYITVQIAGVAKKIPYFDV